MKGRKISPNRKIEGFRKCFSYTKSLRDHRSFSTDVFRMGNVRGRKNTLSNNKSLLSPEGANQNLVFFMLKMEIWSGCPEVQLPMPDPPRLFLPCINISPRKASPIAFLDI